jgi:dipeptidase D
MAVMEDKTLKHGPIEALITADEETGMFGANALPAGELNGDILLNLDSECWGKFVIGSAGGIDVTATLDYKEVETEADDAAVKVTVKGLRGGHSGLEIHEGRGNANKLLVRLVREAIEECEARLASWQGGNMRNAIPFKAEAVLTLPKENVAALKELAADWQDDFQDEYKGIESGIEVICEDVETPKMEVPVEIQDNLINAIYGCHDGVIRMIPSYPNVVETSSNLAIINIGEGKASLKILARSSREDMKDYIVKTLESCFSMAGMKVETAGSYGGWDPNPESEILNLLCKEYKALFGQDGIIQVDHAGLECSIILGKYPHLDVVSFGPTMKSPHTTTERALIATVDPFWTLLKHTLEVIPEK